MVHDDDSYRTWDIDPALEQLELRAPRSNRIKELIQEKVRTHPNWGRLRIWEEICASGTDVDEAEVNWVLDQYRRRNLRR